MHFKRSFGECLQLAVTRKGDKDPYLYGIDGAEALGAYLFIYRCSDSAPELSECAIQWYRSTPESGKKELISGIHTRLHINEAIRVLKKKANNV